MSKDKTRAQSLLAKGKTQEALQILEKIRKKKPKDAENLALMGFVYGGLDINGRAESCLKKSLALAPRADYTYRVQRALAQLLEGRGQYKQAIIHYTNSIKQNPAQLDIYLNLGNCLKYERQIEEAIDIYKQLLKLDPSNHLACRCIGQLYEQSHRLEDARQYVERALNSAPKDIESLFLLATLDLREKKTEQARQQLLDLLKMNLPPQHRAIITKELARLYDKTGDYQMAFKLLGDANRGFESVYVQQKNENGLEAYRSEIDSYVDIISSDMVNNWPIADVEDEGLNIIFLVGFPRSGTTLTERILESHPDIIATHELPILPRMIRAISKIIKRPFTYPEDLGSLNNDEVVLLRSVYIQRMQVSLNVVIDKNKFLLDKLPLNIIHLGFISRVFYDSRVLLALRDPRDVCLSCYTQTFTYNQAMRQFLDFEDTARFYASVMGLWMHYIKVLNIDFIETRYEDIVQDLEQAARRMLTFVGVDWNETVLNFHSSSKAGHVFTPSYQGVTKPIYNSSINKWMNYRKNFKSVAPFLDKYIQEFGYISDN